MAILSISSSLCTSFSFAIFFISLFSDHPSNYTSCPSQSWQPVQCLCWGGGEVGAAEERGSRRRGAFETPTLSLLPSDKQLKHKHSYPGEYEWLWELFGAFWTTGTRLFLLLQLITTLCSSSNTFSRVNKKGITLAGWGRKPLSTGTGVIFGGWGVFERCAQGQLSFY